MLVRTMLLIRISGESVSTVAAGKTETRDGPLDVLEKFQPDTEREADRHTDRTLWLPRIPHSRPPSASHHLVSRNPRPLCARAGYVVGNRTISSGFAPWPSLTMC